MTPGQMANVMPKRQTRRRSSPSGHSPKTMRVKHTVVLLAALLHAPVVMMKAVGRGPGEVYFTLLGLGLLGLAAGTS